MSRNRVNDDVARSDSAVIRDINIDERQYNHPCIYCETQYLVQRGPHNEFRREDNSRGISRGRERDSLGSVTYREDDIEHIEGGDIRSILERLRRVGHIVKVRLLL